MRARRPTSQRFNSLNNGLVQVLKRGKVPPECEEFFLLYIHRNKYSPSGQYPGSRQKCWKTVGGVGHFSPPHFEGINFHFSVIFKQVSIDIQFSLYVKKRPTIKIFTIFRKLTGIEEKPFFRKYFPKSHQDNNASQTPNFAEGLTHLISG